MTQQVKHTIEDCPQNTSLKVMSTKIDALVEYTEDSKEFHREMITTMRQLAENSVQVTNLTSRVDKAERDIDSGWDWQRKADITITEHSDFIKTHNEDDKDQKAMIRSFKVSLGVALLSAGIIAGVSFTFFLVDRMDYTSSKTTTTRTDTKSGR